ncbi:MAG: ABC transporter permease [Thermoleophilaceae bacterium]
MSAAAATIGAFVRRDFTIARSYRFQFVLETAGTLASLVLFFYLSKLIDGTSGSVHDQLPEGYFAFAVVGVALLRLVHAGAAASPTRLRQEQTAGTLEAVASTPARPWVTAIAGGTYELLRALVAVTVTIVLAIAVFGLHVDSSVPGVLAAIGGLLAFALLLAGAGVAIASLTTLVKQTTAVLGLAVTGIALLGGFYFPLDVLPDGLRRIAQALPFSWAADVVRDGLLSARVDGAKLAGLALVAIALLPLALWSFEAAARRARATGTLTHY